MKSLAILTLAVLCGLPLAALADDADVQAALNRAIVQQQLQADLQSRLAMQQAALQNEQLLNTLRLRSSLDQNDAAIRQIMLQQQLNLLRLQLRAVAKPKARVRLSCFLGVDGRFGDVLPERSLRADDEEAPVLDIAASRLKECIVCVARLIES